MRHWLFKSEPDVYSIDDLARDGSTYWDGIRNYQARNLMRDDIAEGDRVLYYHSSCKPTGVVGLAVVVKAAWPDPTQFEPDSRYFDAKATQETPRWFVVDIAFEERFAETLTLAALKADPALDGMMLVRKGARLSIQPVSAEHFDHIVALGRATAG